MIWYQVLGIGAAGVTIAVPFHFLARMRRPDGELGDYWSNVVQQLCLLLLPLLFLSAALETIYRPFWRTG